MKVPTIDELCRAYIATVRSYRKPSTGRTTRTWRTVQSDLRHLRQMVDARPAPGMLFVESPRAVGELPAGELTPDMLAELMVHLAETGQITRDTINRLRATVIRMYNWARKAERPWCRSDATRRSITEAWRELRDVEPLKRGRTPARERRRVMAAGHIDVWQSVQEASFEAATDYRMLDVCDALRVMWESGMRPNEVVQLSLSTIDRSREPWLYRPTEHKTEHHGKLRPIYLGRKTRMALEDRIARVEATGRDWLFEQRTRGGKFTGRPIRVNRLGQLLKDLHERHAITHFTLNQLRHAVATRIARSQDITAASNVLGHSSITTTEIYIDPDDDGLRRIAEEHC